MRRFVLRRLVGMIVVLFAVSVLTFAIFTVIPDGAPEDRMAGRNSTPEQIAAIRREWGFDKPLYVQYARTMKKIFSGDVVSYEDQTDVIDEIKRGAPRTFALAVGAAILWLAAGVALGLYGAARAGRISDRLITVLALVGISMPVFWLGALANHYLGFELGIFPAGGYAEIGEKGLLQWLWHLVLPWCVLAAVFVGAYSRVVRANALDAMNEDYVRAARAKGLSERHVMTHHVLPNSLIPVVTLFGLDFGAVLGGGAVLTESVFDLQGVGQYFAESIGRLDVPPVLAVTMFGTFFIVVLNTVVDIVYAALDPRIRLS
ncbi:MAG: ABC transporter permease [Solirubrobacteraceae bacterium]